MKNLWQILHWMQIIITIQIRSIFHQIVVKRYLCYSVYWTVIDTGQSFYALKYRWLTVILFINLYYTLNCRKIVSKGQGGRSCPKLQLVYSRKMVISSSHSFPIYYFMMNISIFIRSNLYLELLLYRFHTNTYSSFWTKSQA